MPEHYAVMGVDAPLLGAIQTIRYMRSPLAGYLQDVTLDAGAAIGAGNGPAAFQIRKNGAALFSTGSRPVIAAGQQRGAVTGLSLGIAIGDLLTIDLDAAPLGGVPLPLSIRLTFFDTIGLRGQVTYVTAPLADGAIENASIPGMGRTWMLLSATADRASWTRLYDSAAARTADAARLITADPDDNAGVGADLIFTAAHLALAWSAPYPMGCNLDDPQSTAALAAIMNRSGALAAVQTTFNRLVLER